MDSTVNGQMAGLQLSQADPVMLIKETLAHASFGLPGDTKGQGRSI